jgi:hypothetical protein
MEFFNLIKENIEMKTRNSFATLIFFIIFIIGETFAYTMVNGSALVGGTVVGVITLIVALIVSNSIKIADQWEKAVILRLG